MGIFIFSTARPQDTRPAISALSTALPWASVDPRNGVAEAVPMGPSLVHHTLARCTRVAARLKRSVPSTSRYWFASGSYSADQPQFFHQLLAPGLMQGGGYTTAEPEHSSSYTSNQGPPFE